MDLREWNQCVSERKNTKPYKYIEDVRQDEKHVPSLLESIIQPPGLVKEELRPIVFKISQFRLETTKIWV